MKAFFWNRGGPAILKFSFLHPGVQLWTAWSLRAPISRDFFRKALSFPSVYAPMLHRCVVFNLDWVTVYDNACCFFYMYASVPNKVDQPLLNHLSFDPFTFFVRNHWKLLFFVQNARNDFCCLGYLIFVVRNNTDKNCIQDVIQNENQFFIPLQGPEAFLNGRASHM